MVKINEEQQKAKLTCQSNWASQSSVKVACRRVRKIKQLKNNVHKRQQQLHVYMQLILWVGDGILLNNAGENIMKEVLCSLVSYNFGYRKMLLCFIHELNNNRWKTSYTDSITQQHQLIHMNYTVQQPTWSEMMQREVPLVTINHKRERLQHTTDSYHNPKGCNPSLKRKDIPHVIYIEKQGECWIKITGGW